MRIVFFCPSVTTINGGIKHIFRMAETLIALGFDAVVFEPNGQRPNWFHSTAPIVGQGIFTSNVDHIYVLPEDQPHILADFAKMPQRKVIYSQNHFYGALGIGDADSYADYGVTDILCSSRTIFDHAKLRHPKLRAHVIPCAVDQDLFKPTAIKKSAIAYMPRKRSIEATYIRDMFCFSFPQYKDWQWVEIAGRSEVEAASLLGECRVFLSLSRLEGFGLTPLEAMAAGCVVAGFTGIGGREYATPQNGFWADEDDFPACVQQLGKAVELTLNPSALTGYFAQAQKTIAGFTPLGFNNAVQEVWSKIISA